MAQKRLLKLSAILRYLGDDIKCLEKGENSVEMKNVVRVNYDETTGIISGYVFASSRTKQYKVDLFLNEERKIKEAFCTCTQGKAKCYHVAAVALFGHYNIAEALHNILTLQSDSDSDTESLTNATYNVFQKQPNKSELSESDLTSESNRCESWVENSASTGTEALLVPNIGSLIFSAEFRHSSNKKRYFQEKCFVTKGVIDYLADITVGQVDNPDWLLYRRFRLMDSHFGAALKACQEQKYSASLFEKLTGTHTFESTQAIEWRKEHECDAVESFALLTGTEVIPTGLWLHPCGYLGVNPDGLVGEDGIIEIKLPFKYKETDLKTALTQDDSYICKYDEEEDHFIIDETHNYYHQVQGQLHVLGKKICYLVIWTPYQIIVLNIEKDPQWAQNIDVLQDFYLNYFLNYIVYGE